MIYFYQTVELQTILWTNRKIAWAPIWNGSMYIYMLPFQYIYMEYVRLSYSIHVYMLLFQTENGKRESRHFLPLLVMQTEVVCLFLNEETNGSYPFANRLNGLNRLNGFSHLCIQDTIYISATWPLWGENPPLPSHMADVKWGAAPTPPPTALWEEFL